ncbi:MAG: hypothetical protein HY295_06140 [Thaumarchaeota archaeon]|nr:hypothetical protein [Nitrososphaerota archaeon]
MPVSITLNNSFIEKYKNRATMDIDFTLTSNKFVPHPGKDDGDMHLAGTAPQVGFATVSEIMNAKDADVYDTLKAAWESGDPISLSGAWRIWPEHGTGSFVQGQEGDIGASTNPNHISEIHPVTQVGTISVMDSVREIEGFQYKNATKAFQQYEKVGCTLKFTEKKTTLNLSRTIGYNYVKYVIEPHEKGIENKAKDALLVRCSVFDADTGELVVKDRRMVFIKGTTSYDLFKQKDGGVRMNVYGLPRVDLALVSWRVNNSTKKQGVTDWPLPYEMVIVGNWES